MRRGHPARGRSSMAPRTRVGAAAVARHPHERSLARRTGRASPVAQRAQRLRPGRHHARRRRRARRRAPRRSRWRCRRSCPCFTWRACSMCTCVRCIGSQTGKLQLRMEQIGFDDVRPDRLLKFDDAALVAAEYNRVAVANEEAAFDIFPRPQVSEDERASLPLRPPVVTIMGHVDHGRRRCSIRCALRPLRRARRVALRSTSVRSVCP